MGVFITFFKEVFAGNYDFYAFVGKLGELLNNAGFKSVFDFIEGLGVVAGVAAIAFGALQIFYGKKFLPFFKFLAVAGVGYLMGQGPVAEVLAANIPEVSIPSFVVGIMVALVAAVLHKVIYWLLLFGAAGVFSYVIFYAGGLIPMELPTVGNSMMSYIAVGVVLFLLLVMKKNAERLGTAFLGGFLVTYGVKKFFDYTALLPDYALIIDIAVMALLAVIGFVYQYKRRRRY